MSDTHTTWRDSVIHKLRNRPRGLSLETVARDLDVSLGWLKALSSRKGEALNPGINTMEALDRYLTEQASHV